MTREELEDDLRLLHIMRGGVAYRLGKQVQAEDVIARILAAFDDRDSATEAAVKLARIMLRRALGAREDTTLRVYADDALREIGLLESSAPYKKRTPTDLGRALLSMGEKEEV